MEDIGEIYNRLEANCPNLSSNSKMLWKLRREYSRLKDRNKSKEVLLERAVVMLAYNYHMHGWFNQCPTTSGITDSRNNKKSSIDLVHYCESEQKARLVELKWKSNNPIYALKEILRYGAAYVFCRTHNNSLPLQNRRLMEARHISLEVAAPVFYYENHHDLAAVLTRMREFLDNFHVSSLINGLTMSLNVLVFPEDFDKLPFKNGKEVKQKCDTQHLTTEGRIVRDAFNSLIPVV